MSFFVVSYKSRNFNLLHLLWIVIPVQFLSDYNQNIIYYFSNFLSYKPYQEDKTAQKKGRGKVCTRKLQNHHGITTNALLERYQIKLSFSFMKSYYITQMTAVRCLQSILVCKKQTAAKHKHFAFLNYWLCCYQPHKSEWTQFHCSRKLQTLHQNCFRKCLCAW